MDDFEDDGGDDKEDQEHVADGVGCCRSDFHGHGAFEVVVSVG